MSKELKPVRCGCGGEAKVETDHDTLVPGEPIDWKRVRCSKCNIRTTWRHTEAEAVEAWNWAMGADRCCNTCDSYEAGRYCLLWSIFCPSDHWCKDWSGNE